MKILHTSDWHLGQLFMTRSRKAEHEAFLQWLLQKVQQESIDVVIVAGDIFDTATPPNYALELYYNFLTRLSSICKHIIITAGNHDSIATLKASQQLLKALNISVITSGDKSEDEIIEIVEDDKLLAVVCAVPFLRDYVVRQSQNAQSMSQKETALSEGIVTHYQRVYEEALLRVDKKDIPIIATGHLTVLGSQTSESEREIYIGTSLAIDSAFLARFDYVALGHLHTNQKVGYQHVRYSGSPIPLSFSEASTQKKVNIVEFEGKKPMIHEVQIPSFRPLVVLRGDLHAVVTSLETIKDKQSWIEVHLDDSNPFFANQQIRQKASELDLTLLAVKIQTAQHATQQDDFKVLSLEQLTPKDLFIKRLEQEEGIDKKFQEQLLACFEEVEYEVEQG